MSAPCVGEIRAVGFNFAPLGWAACNGQSLSISEYEALYSLIGTAYGGDGVNTFNVPDLRSRVGVGSQGPAPGPGLSAYQLGQQGGQEGVTLTANQLPAHQHPFTAQLLGTNTGTATSTPVNNRPGSSSGNPYNDTPTPGNTLAANAVTGGTTSTGGSQPHNNVQPVQAMNFIIATEGYYPSRP